MNSLILALHLSAVVTAGAAESQQPNNWSAWYGCWKAEGAPDNEVICIASVNAGVRISTFVDGRAQDESTVVADGLARRVTQNGCNGSERARWSRDGRRVFLESDVACGSTVPRNVRGLFAFVAPDEWISVQSAAEGDSVATRIVRFIAVPSGQVPVASFASGRGVDESMLVVDESDVSEAVDHLGALAAQEWMKEAGEPFELAYNNSQQRAGGSALDQVGRFSNPTPVVVREVVRVVERPVYVHNHYDYDRWYYSPWSYRYSSWRWYHRPVIVIRLPIIISRNVHYHRDYYKYRYRNYDRYRYGRHDGYRDYDRHRDYDRDRNYDRDRSRGTVTRDGYSSGRDRTRDNSSITRVQRTPTTPRDRAETPRETTEQPRVRTEQPRERVAQPRERSSGGETRARVTQTRERERTSTSSTRSERARSEPARSTAGSSRSSDSGSRTAKARGSRN